jgi:phosphoribosylformylglycinamidine cyclo-ligase
VGGIATDELEHTLNMGVGMVAVLPADAADAALAALTELGQQAWVLGAIERAQSPAGGGSAALVGRYAQ